MLSLSCRLLSCCLSLFLAAPGALAASSGVAFWVWARSSPLQSHEVAALEAQGVDTLYWHIGEVTTEGGSWRWVARSKIPPLVGGSLRVVPVIRISPRTGAPFGKADQLVAMLQSDIPGATIEAIQLDFDCPERLLSDYAQLTAAVRASVPWVSITALAHWIDLSAFRLLENAADELVPMFYDLEPDPVVGRGKFPYPAVEPERVGNLMERWSRCAKPWRAGVPSFARLTVYDRNGRSRGHVRNFDWADVCFNPALVAREGGRLGTTLWQVSKPAVVCGTPVAEGEFVAARWPDRQALVSALTMAKKAGARGAVWFRLPERADAAGWSLQQIGEISRGEFTAPPLHLESLPDGRLILRNETETDLAPRLRGKGGPRDRGYALELDASGPIFREVLEGDFWRVAGHIDPEQSARAVAVPLATRVTLWFSHLRAGETLESGLLTLAPNATRREIRYRILDVPGAEEWRPLP